MYKNEHNHWLYKGVRIYLKSQTNQHENIREVSEISQDKLSPMPEKSALIFHHNFYPKPKVP